MTKKQRKKRSNPSYLSVSGYITKALALDFKTKKVKHELTQSEALEQAVELWVARDRGKFVYPLATDTITQQNP